MEWKNYTFFLQKYIRLYFTRQGSKLHLVCERQRQGNEDRLPYWPITSSSLDHTTLLSSKPHLFSSPTRRTQPVAASRQQDWPLTHARLTISHMGICMYYFTMPTHFHSTIWLLPLIYIGDSCAEKSLIDGSVKAQYITMYGLIVWYPNENNKILVSLV